MLKKSRPYPYVDFDGLDNAAPIVNEHAFRGNLCKILPQLDTFIETTIAKKHPVPVSALREETVYEYPKWSIRELMMNAIMHRDYQGNAPIKFYQYRDRLEIVNHGGLYGRARPENFPKINDYRNPIIAEAIKLLGYVNCYNRGIATLQEELEANGNGAARFSFGLVTAFEATVMKSCNDPINDPINPSKSVQKSNKPENNRTCDPINDPINDPIKLAIFQYVKQNPGCKRVDISIAVGVSVTTIKRIVNLMKEEVEYRGSNKKGGYYVREGGVR